MNGRLPPYLRRALAALWRAVEESEHGQSQGIPKDHAERVLVAHDEAERENGKESAPLPAEEVDRRLDYLRDHGQIYYVDDWVRITIPEDVAADLAESDADTK